MPVLWDTKTETIVNNESAEIVQMLETEFDAFIPEERRESVRPLFPESLRDEIETMNAWVYDSINNGVYKTGFASTQEAYDENLTKVFDGLDRIEKHLKEKGGKYLFGDHITEADIRLFTTVVRFDAAYFTLFRCNLRMIRYEYPKLHDWIRRLYWDEGAESNGGAFRETTKFDQVSWTPAL